MGQSVMCANDHTEQDHHSWEHCKYCVWNIMQHPKLQVVSSHSQFHGSRRWQRRIKTTHRFYSSASCFILFLLCNVSYTRDKMRRKRSLGQLYSNAVCTAGSAGHTADLLPQIIVLYPLMLPVLFLQGLTIEHHRLKTHQGRKRKQYFHSVVLF